MPAHTDVKEKKAKIVEKFGKNANNTGSSEVQIALLTDRINTITPHLKVNAKDFHTQRGLLKLVGQRRRLLNYLKSCDHSRYATVIDQLGLRK